MALGAQALSSVSTKAAPRLAVSLFPLNGAAREELAFKAFTDGVTQPEDAPQSAAAASDLARAAIRAEPLGIKSHVILALAESNEAAQRQLVEAATLLNRRNLSLQGLALQAHLAEGDYPKTIATLDQILRVHPKYYAEFFPVLTQALTQTETVPVFAQLLDGSAPWHERFLAYAVRQPEARPNLAVMRQEIVVEDSENFDRQLIFGLTASGDIDTAESIYRSVSGVKDSMAATGPIDWRAAYPPFEWQLVDQPGFRAQTSQDGQQLELAVRPGKGGLIASRLLRTPQTPFEIRVAQRIAPAEQARDVRLQLFCAGDTTPTYDERLSGDASNFRIASLPAGCDHLILGINARAWSGRSALGGTIDSIEFVPASVQAAS